MFARFLLAALLAAWTLPAETPSGIFSEVDRITTTLSEITGWPVHRKVPSEILHHDEFRKYLEGHMKGRSAAREIHAEEQALKMFGLVPQDFNLKSETVDLMSEQAAAFYDYQRKRLYILDSTAQASDEDKRMALVHELAHALADQQHPLGKYLNHGDPDDDEATAREAVMEGQATWLTWAYEAKIRGLKPEVPAGMIERLTEEQEPPDGTSPVFSSAPLYIRESLVFPYDAGARFQDAVFRKMGAAAFERVFQMPPRSTQQIMHPAEYMEDVKPTQPDPPGLEALLKKDSHQFKMLAEGSVGEFDHDVLIRQYTGEKDNSSAVHWRGGSFHLYEHKKEGYPLLAYVSEWDSPQAAQNFFRLYQQVLNGKWKKMQVISRTPNELLGSGDSGKFQLRIMGSFVQSVEGLR